MAGLQIILAIVGISRVFAEEPPAEEPALKVTVYMVWASHGEPGVKPPKELEPFLEPLRKIYPGGAFRLHEKPLAATLDGSKDLTLKLPQGYETRWSLEREDGGKAALRQILTNPRKVQSVDLLKKSPAITHLRRIRDRDGAATFLLIVDFQPRGADAK